MDQQPRNTHAEDIEDIPREKIRRSDGLPTVDDMASMLGKPVPEDVEQAKRKKAKGIFDGREDNSVEDNRSESDHSSACDSLSDFIEVIVRIPKP